MNLNTEARRHRDIIRRPFAVEFNKNSASLCLCVQNCLQIYNNLLYDNV